MDAAFLFILVLRHCSVFELVDLWIPAARLYCPVGSYEPSLLFLLRVRCFVGGSLQTDPGSKLYTFIIAVTWVHRVTDLASQGTVATSCRRPQRFPLVISPYLSISLSPCLSVFLDFVSF